MEIKDMTLEEVEARLSALETEVAESEDTEFINGKATEEKRALLERKAELKDLEERKQIANAINEGSVQGTVKEERKMEETKMEFTRESKEYRNAWLKNLQGAKLNEAEQRAIAQTDVQGAIPTMVSDKFFEKMKKLAPMVNEITLLQVAGNVTFTVENVRDDASVHTENANITAGGNDSFVKVSLGAIEFAKVIGISKTVKAMAIDSFENWLIEILSGDIARAIDNYIINDATNGLSANTYIASTKVTATYGYTDICNLIADLPAAYDSEAKFLMNKKTFYGDIKAIVDNNKRPIFDEKDKTIMGYPVLLDDYVTSAKSPIYLGKFTDIVGNLSIPCEVEASTESGFTSGTIQYRGFAAFDSKLAKTDAIVKMYRS